MMFYGLLDLPWWGNILVTIIFTHITIASVTIYLHRHQAHRALDLHPISSHFFRLWLWLTTGIKTKSWTAIHRKHHAKCETSEDPHSPQVFGLTTVLAKGAELYKKEACNEETLQRYGQGTPDDWLENNLYFPHSRLGVIIMLITNVILFGVPGFAIWATQMAWNPLFAAGVINGIGHFWGYRNFECRDAATNIMPWGIIIGGEELHNNHHTYPTSAKLSVKKWEFDIGWLYIRLLALFGLAKVKRVPPKPTIVPHKKQIDLEALQALLNNRIQVMTTYSKTVVLPLFKQQKKFAEPKKRRLLQRMKAALMKADILVDDPGRYYLEKFLEENKALQVVYHFGEQLKSIWNRTTATQKELLEALQDWCQQAEKTGVQKLQEFTTYLKGYTISSSIA
jgi:stearoyl-CoA desaturase (delta-9 desaturase)